MIIEDKNKLKSKIKSKILVLGLIIIFVLIGLFSSTRSIYATSLPDPGSCLISGTRTSLSILYGTVTTNVSVTVPRVTSGDCTYSVMSASQIKMNDGTDVKSSDNYNWLPAAYNGTGAEQIKNATDKVTAFQEAVNEWKCGIGGPYGGSITGCIVQGVYIFYYSIPAFLLWVVGYVFNVLLSVSLSPDLLRMPFVGEAWGIVRDLSNLFFILILLYIAIKIILDLGGGEAKKMIARVIIVALLINFSMFFTEVIIDSANMVALIFYNQVGTKVTKPDGTEIPYDKIGEEKDIAGALVTNFDPTTSMTEPFLTATKVMYGLEVHESTADYAGNKVPMGIIIALLLLAGSMMYYVAIVLGIVSIFFLLRLIELWVLIIFSPFAFMSSTIPSLSGIEYIGWSQWFKRLTKTAFMAPIFMFFLYFIFLLIQSNLFKSIIPDPSATGPTSAVLIKLVLGMVLPLCFVEILLYKALKFAISSSGKLGEVALTGLKAVSGLALAAVSGGAALALQGTIGKSAQAVANNDELRKTAAGGGPGAKAAQKRLDRANFLAKSSFDIRQTGVGKFAAKKTGVDISFGQEELKGGVRAKAEKKYEKEEERAKSYEMTPSAAMEQDKAARIRNNRVAQYEKDEAEAKKKWEEDEDNKKNGVEFNKEEFQRFYVRGANQTEAYKAYKLNKAIEGGSVEKEKTSAEINADRRQAYTESRLHPNVKRDENGEIVLNERGEADKKGIKDSLKELGGLWKEGMKSMVNTPGGLATTAAIGSMTMGIGAAVAIPIGGLAIAIKDIIKAQARPDKDLMARVARGKTTDQKLLELFKKSAGGDKKAQAELLKETKKHNEKESEKATEPPANPPTEHH